MSALTGFFDIALVLGVLFLTFALPFFIIKKLFNNAGDRNIAQRHFRQIETDHDPSQPVTFGNLPKGTRLSTFKERPVAVLPDGSVIAATAGDPNRPFASAEEYRAYVGSSKAIPFA